MILFLSIFRKRKFKKNMSKKMSKKMSEKFEKEDVSKVSISREFEVPETKENKRTVEKLFCPECTTYFKYPITKEEKETRIVIVECPNCGK